MLCAQPFPPSAPYKILVPPFRKIPEFLATPLHTGLLSHLSPSHQMHIATSALQVTWKHLTLIPIFSDLWLSGTKIHINPLALKIVGKHRTLIHISPDPWKEILKAWCLSGMAPGISTSKSGSLSMTTLKIRDDTVSSALWGYCTRQLIRERCITFRPIRPTLVLRENRRSAITVCWGLKPSGNEKYIY